MLMILCLEVIIRIFHLYPEDPVRFIDNYGVEKRVPNQRGFYVTGNRNQQFTQFNINSNGFNSFRNFTPSYRKVEIALVGDSYIEGLHQDFFNSTGKKIENRINDIEVYEYGYSGYDFADQLHLIHAYQDKFDLIDEIIIYFNYQNDLVRGEYVPNQERINTLSSPIFSLRNNIKILSYGSKIGIFEPLKKFAIQLGSGEATKNANSVNSSISTIEKDIKYLLNFQKLIRTYGFDKNKTTLLLDSRKTNETFLGYCKLNGIKFIDYSPSFSASKKTTDLIYDAHWNDHGRELIAEQISEYMLYKVNNHKKSKYHVNL